MTLAFTFFDGLLLSLLSILFVILIISMIVLAITPLKKLSPQNQQTMTTSKTPIKNQDILDEDMMVAALIASIDYLESTKKEPYLKSIREIKS